MRIVKGREATLRLYCENEGGTLVAATSTPTLAITNTAGTVVSAGSVTNPSTGLYEAVVAPQSSFTDLHAIWSYAVSGNSRTEEQHYTIVAERLVPLSTLATDAKISDVTPAVTTVQLLGLINQVEDWIVRALKFPYCEQAFTRTFTVKKTTQVLHIPRVLYPKSVTAVTRDDIVFTADEIDDIKIDTYGIERGTTGWSFLTGSNPNAGGWQPGRYVISGTHGPSPELAYIPADLRRAALSLARYAIRTNNWSERARQVQTQDAVLTFSMPSPDRPTGLPEVDAVVTGYGHKPVV